MPTPRTKKPPPKVCGIDPKDTRCNSKATQNQGFCTVNASNRCVFARNPQRPRNNYTLNEIRALLPVRQRSDALASQHSETESHSEREPHSEMQHEIFDLLTTAAMDDWRAKEKATRRIVALVRGSEPDLVVVADVAVVPLVSLLSYRIGLAAMWAAEALYWIAHRGGDARILQIAQANVTAPLVALIAFQSTGGGLDSTNVDQQYTFEMIGLLARHPSTVNLVVQAGATRPLVGALKVRENDRVFHAAATALADIIRFDATQIAIVLSAGAMPSIVRCLTRPRFATSAVELVGTLATEPHGRASILADGGIEPLVALLAHPSRIIVTIVTYTLAQLSADNACRSAMMSPNVVYALRHAYSQHNTPVIGVNVLFALEHLTS